MEGSVAREDREIQILGLNLLEEVLEKNNLRDALKKVKSNKGSAGMDGLQVFELGPYLKDNWLRVKDELLSSNYKPKPVLRVEIPKPNSQEKRKLGIPSVLDRFLQQALLQVLQKYWDRSFSEHSFGFRPKRSAHQAVRLSQSYLRSGKKVVLDIDLEKFFDRVNHDRLMSQLAKKIEDKRVLQLIRSFLTSGILEDGLVKPSTEGAPQGGPLSPFLSNFVLNELDEELEKRGHSFVRYADDCNIYVSNIRAGERLMESVTYFIEKKLKLRVNQSKSAVGDARHRKFLGFSFIHVGSKKYQIRISNESLSRVRSKIRWYTKRSLGRSLSSVIERLNIYLTGWKSYYQLSETPSVFQGLDQWIRRRLRSYLWKNWSNYTTRVKELMRLNLCRWQAIQTAWKSQSPWRMSNDIVVAKVLSVKYFDNLGLKRLRF